jgi:tryptophan synthase alpha subunit
MNKIMTHVVAGYPTFSECIDLMKMMKTAGVNMVEVQIPFSDPIADGETIMRANDEALKQGMTVEKCFELIRKANLTIEVYVMSYYQKINHTGLEKFCKLAGQTGSKGLIIPDLSFDAPEYSKLLKIAAEYDLELVPVISPGMSHVRLDKALENSKSLIYLTSMKGITGRNMHIDSELTDIAKYVKIARPDAVLAIGFGISNRKDLLEVLKIGDVGVIGSAVIRKIDSNGMEAAVDFISDMKIS